VLSPLNVDISTCNLATKSAAFAVYPLTDQIPFEPPRSTR